MYKVPQVTANPLQTQTLVLPDGSQIQIEMYYRQQQYGWFFNSISYGDFVLQGFRITVNPNMLHQWKNRIPFGIACVASVPREPTQQGDFAAGLFTLYVLDATDVATYTEFLEGKI